MAKVRVVEQETNQPEATPPVDKRIALVIGGGGGIGSAICLALASDGFDIAVHYFSNPQRAQKVAAEVAHLGSRALVVGADIQAESEVDAMVQQVERRLGPIAVLVNCATARIAAISFTDLRWSDFEAHLGMSIRGSFLLARRVAPSMVARGSGKIIQIGSQASESPSLDWLPYITGKSALVGFTHALALELAPKGITVNMVSPGMTQTEQIADIPERQRLFAAAKTPLRRLARPEDVAGAVAYLASSRADYLTGETIRVNGGQVMR